jgi:hypothetical protein
MSIKNSATTQSEDVERLQFYISGSLRERFWKYVEHFRPTYGKNIITFTIKRALDEFLKREGY